MPHKNGDHFLSNKKRKKYTIPASIDFLVGFSHLDHEKQQW